MNTRNPSRIAAALAGLLVGIAAQAHDVECGAPKAEWRKQMELQDKLTAEGWKVRKVKVEKDCYEVYGFDAKGEKAEAFFNPKTFERVYERGTEPKP
jgi:hypothetical protein